MPLLLLHHAFQGSLLLWDYGEESHIFPLAKKTPKTIADPHTHTDIRATLVADMELVSKSR